MVDTISARYNASEHQHRTLTINEPQGIRNLPPLAARRYRAHTLVQGDAKGGEHMFGLAVGILAAARGFAVEGEVVGVCAACAPVSAVN